MADCKCTVDVQVCDDGTFYPILYCPVHEAAPDLLAACEALLKFNEELCEDVGVSKHYPSAEKARAAIKKARRQNG